MLVNQECLPCLRTLTLRTLDLSLAQKPRLAHKKAALQKFYWPILTGNSVRIKFRRCYSPR
jgi:hypothetical protein